MAKFVNGGGTLAIDSCGGGLEFAASADAELAAMFPNGFEQLKQPLKFDHALYKTLGMPADEIAYRPFSTRLLGNLKGPRLRGIEIGGRLAVIQSNEDLSVGLVGQHVDGIVGYTPRCASAIMAAILDGVAK